jgi:hypothetical protein
MPGGSPCNFHLSQRALGHFFPIQAMENWQYTHILIAVFLNVFQNLRDMTAKLRIPMRSKPVCFSAGVVVAFRCALRRRKNEGGGITHILLPMEQQILLCQPGHLCAELASFPI